MLDEEREQLDFATELQQAADVWSRRGRRTSEVWTGAALQDALARAERAAVPLPETARVFLEEGRREDRRRAHQRSAAVVSLVGFLFIIAAALFVARGRAVEAADEARMARAIAEREAAEAALSRGDLWSARAKVRTSLELDDSLAARALWRRVDADALLFSTTLSGPAIDGAFAPDGSVFVARANDRAFLFAPGTFVARDFAVFRNPRDSVDTVGLIGDRALLGLRDDGRVGLIDLSGQTPPRIVDLHRGGVLAIAALPDRGLFVSAGGDGHLRVIDRDGVVGDSLLAHDVGIDRLVPTPDGRALMALGSDEQIIEVPLSPGVAGPPPVQLAQDARDLVVLPDGVVLVGTIDGTVLRLEGDRRLTPIANVGDIARLAVDPRGRVLAARSTDGEVTLWRISHDAVSTSLRPIAFLGGGGEGELGALTIDRDGSRLLATTRDGDVRIWRIDDESISRRIEPSAPYNHVAISSDGTRVADMGEDGIFVRDTRRGDLVGHVPTDEGAHTFTLDEDGTRVLVGSDQRVTVHHLDGSAAPTSFVLDAPLTAATVLSDGGFVVATRRSIQRIAPTGGPPVVGRTVDTAAVTITASPDGELLILGGRDGGAVVLETATLKERRRFRVTDGLSVSGAVFSPDGTRVALSTSSVLEVREVANGNLVRRLLGERIIGACTGFLGDGRVVDMRADGVVVIDADSGEEQPRFNVPPTGSCQMTAGGLMAMRLGDYVQPYDVGLDAPLWFARGVVAGAISTQRGGPTWPPATSPGITSVEEGPGHLCSTESGAAFVMRSLDGTRVLARAIDDASWPMVKASRGGCVWQRGETLVRLRPGGDVGVVDVVARDVVSFGGGGGVVVVIGGGRVRVVDVDGGGPERVLPPGDVVIDGSGAVAVQDGKVAHALPSGEIAVWELDGGTPRVVRIAPGDIGAVLPLPGGAVAVGRMGERLMVVDMASGAVVIEERVRGAVGALHVRSDGDGPQRRFTLLAGTNLGVVHHFDVTPLVGERCAVLRTVWAAAPVAWEHGHPTPLPPPSSHPCMTDR